jgi:hybrid cluster-associated redox disulfide protein
MKITKDMTVGDVVRQFPGAAEVLQSFGMGCVFCPSAQGENLEQAAIVHGLDLNALLEALNK